MQTHINAALYQKTIWSCDLMEGFESSFSMNCKEKVEKLEEKVMTLFIDYENGGLITLQLLELIDDIERMGLGYRFQPDITRVLRKVASKHYATKEEEEDNLHAVSLEFRLLRQHGFSVSQDFLKRFKDTDGSLIGCLHADVEATLSLYEASYLALEGELDLDDAKLIVVKSLLNLNYPNENDHINHALDVPLYRRMHRLQARWYIDAYGKRKDANQMLLELAILDFNMVQSAHKRELQNVSRWWNKIGLASKLSFSRDRLMECFFWSVGMVFEPQYYSCRLGLTKVGALITTIDDIYDVYGSIDELKVFTDAVKRWDINAMKHMSEVLQVGFLALYNTINDMGYDTLVAQGTNIIPILAKVWGELTEAFFVEAKWNHINYKPTLEDYLDNAWRSVSGVVILTHGYFLMNQDAKKDVTKSSMGKFDNLIKWSSMIFRLYNDLATSSDEMDRGKSVNAISCYMQEHDVCEQVARKYIKSLIDKAWKKMIEARVACPDDSKDPFIDMAINLARISHCTYQYGDGHGAPDARSKDRVLSVIFEPIREQEH
ncbi:putative (E)-beta-ocimene synthase [Helianthus annuus]|nr:putative (E)-beta-ocimene synthase [Helianthus annuus]KAJ0684237.1 putative (E)-beta-ocimene synthase [Helianthus annuus]KAJ0688189.1 putative (E)-beta-ocimene synthase [Helianthus annuus]KAJ0869248.1 putative (E)-beta-ocimene synthase [Helianthus annuus]